MGGSLSPFFGHFLFPGVSGGQNKTFDLRIRRQWLYHGATTFSIKTLRIMTFSIRKLSI